jgi:hypothetical protein
MYGRVIKEILKGKRLVALSLMGGILFNYPILSLFNLEMSICGIPLLYLYLFSVWAVIIFLTIVITKLGKPIPEKKSNFSVKR